MSAPPSEVVDRLDRLADHAPTGSLDPSAVWERGRRRQRLRWAVVMACAAVLAGLGATAAAPLVRWADPPVASVPQRAGMVLPDVIRPPGRWAPAFGDAPGPLSSVARAPRGGWPNDRASLWGISALTGESRFLDLPAAAPTLDSAALSDDGTRLAYWTSVGSAGESTMSEGGRVSTGVAVLDLVTSHVRQWDAGTELGLGTEALVWAGDVLWFRVGAFRDTEQNSYVPTTWAWGPNGEPEVATGSFWDGMTLTTPGADGFLVADGSAARWVRTVNARGDFTSLRLVHDGSTTSSPSVSPDGRLIVGLQQTPPGETFGAPLPLLVGAVEGRRVVMEPVGDVEASAVLGWRSSTEVVVASTGDVGVPDLLEVSLVDVTNGAVSHLLEASSAGPITFASDAWAGDVIAAPPAPFAPDPRLVGLLAAVVLVLAAAGWRIVRGRRGHP